MKYFFYTVQFLSAAKLLVVVCVRLTPRKDVLVFLLLAFFVLHNSIGSQKIIILKMSLFLKYYLLFYQSIALSIYLTIINVSISSIRQSIILYSITSDPGVSILLFLFLSVAKVVVLVGFIVVLSIPTTVLPLFFSLFYPIYLYIPDSLSHLSFSCWMEKERGRQESKRQRN